MVRVLKIEYLNRITKFLSLTDSVGRAREKVISYHHLNCKNYASVHGEYKGEVYTIIDIDITNVPLISSVQAVSDLEALYNNCLDNGVLIDEATLTSMEAEIRKIKDHFDYDTMKLYEKHVLH